MRVPRGLVWLLGLGLVSPSLKAPAIGAEGAREGTGFVELHVPNAPLPLALRGADEAIAAAEPLLAEAVPPSAVSVGVEPAVPAVAASAVPAGFESAAAQSAPAPTVAPAQAEIPDPTRTGSVAETVLPEPPSAAALAAGDPDAVSGAISLKLADAKSIWLPRTPKRDRDAFAALYAAGGYKPLWIAAGGWGAAARSAIERLSHADEDGLDPAEYPIPVIALGPSPASPADLAEAELKLSVAVALYARDARGGRIDPARISALITPKLDLPSPETVLPALAASPDAGAALAAYNPAYPGYRALRAKLAELRARRPAGSPMVRRMQRQVLTTQAIATLDDAPSLRAAEPWSNPRLEGDIVANMERWRWLPRDVASRYIAVNIPEFRLRIMEGTRVAHETRVIIGKPDSPTPLFSGLVEYAVVNPSWYLPPSILKKEFLPKLAADPTYAARLGYDVVRRGNAISIRQPPGEKNALGFIKFMFPNQHAVYLHDTPNRTLFAAARRAFSHGCVRVEQPFQLADALLGSAWSETRLRKLIGHGERTIWLPEKVPVHLSYFTTVVDEVGELRSFEDIYGYNRKVRAALGLGA